ncbi:hypothetical protein GQ457_06G026570 [Hibiscus cannabinus]
MPSLPILLFSLLFLFPVSHSNPELLFENCRDAVFECGEISIGYPFFGGDRQRECGHSGLELHCDSDNDTDTATIEIHGVKYKVMDIQQERQTLRIAREDFLKDSLCRPQTPIQDSVIDLELFDLAPGYSNVTLLYDCPSSSSVPSSLACNDSDYHNVSIITVTDDFRVEGCSANVTFPISKERSIFQNDLLWSLREAGFEVKWKEDTQACRSCTASGGACGFNIFNSQTSCFCPFGFQNSIESPNQCLRPAEESKSKLKQNLFIGLAVAVTIAIVLVSAVYFLVLRCKGKSLSDHLCQGKIKDNAGIESFIKKFGSPAPRRYSYREIKKMTNKFDNKLGQGGYGTVYKGKLSEGRLVAVKILDGSKGNGEDFMNEVASISRTSHVNIVTLLGFCFEKSKRALVYEFMSHGSLDRFIYDRDLHHQICRLELKTLYDITLDIARGLEYLHQGCNKRILHFDIKPHNILLDENFCPKISDFGLSKLCERKESAISMTCARGTIGYIAPEMVCRSFGGVSYKSDVYSYGMMVLEIVGGRKNVDVEVSQTSEVYFPSWIYKHLDRSMNRDLSGEIIDEEDIKRKLIIVGLWCIQSYPSDRPSMAEVLEMLQGDLQSLVIPPRPFASSPVRSPKTYTKTSS